MLRDITLGQYFPGTSPIHKVDPRLKIVLTALLILALFLCDTPVPYIILTAFILVVVRMAHLTLRMILKGLKPILFIILFTAVINLFATPGVEVWSAGPIHVTEAGCYMALLIVARLVLLIAGTSVLTYTTSPIQLTDGLESLLSPLKRLHAPVHELAMMMSIALRVIPTLIEETDKIMSAQKARGAAFDSGNLLQRAKALIPILIPLFVSAIRRADELATAMECRLYQGGEGRTRLNPMALGRIDAAAAAVFCVVVGLALFWQYAM